MTGIYRSDKEIEERKSQIRERELNKKSVEEVRKSLFNYCKPSRWERFEYWFNRNFEWFLTNGNKTK